ncbi:hypothetical protein GCM10017044_02990 [Kordiimonas sediminis]|uniref:Aminoacetone oxidase family FAD-binding enzyme n=1 Tax=Kordiimonas sediminis TaxID=1735581 RepID=A0A919AKE1_9PROT|nr:NAD(P)/FAD-dependent oxidoreductase [Kordiimonas sediminis]GHF12441.1 hypothetical protein GCM10017044_02990 [Kordiimonas sediminis]
MPVSYDAVVLGGGAAGLYCALTAAQRGLRVLVMEHGKKAGAKILISGGGRCNFTNEEALPTRYISQNPHFAKSALSRHTHWDFISLISQHGITWHEKKLGQLFSDQGSKAILQALLDECSAAGVTLLTDCSVTGVEYGGGSYQLATTKGDFFAPKLVVATGGPSIPKMGATGFAYDLARQFGLGVVDPVPALVPLTFSNTDLVFMKALAGVSLDSEVRCGTVGFRENLLFTHRGLSGPAILQISSYWHTGEPLVIDVLPGVPDCAAWLRSVRAKNPQLQLVKCLQEYLPDRFVSAFLQLYVPEAADVSLGQMSNVLIDRLVSELKGWTVYPVGTEGFAKAEVTRGGVSTADLSSKTMEAKEQPGLYFIGECVDVTGWLGGYNFQWAWSSAWAAAQAL